MLLNTFKGGLPQADNTWHEQKCQKSFLKIFCHSNCIHSRSLDFSKSRFNVFIKYHPDEMPSLKRQLPVTLIERRNNYIIVMSSGQKGAEKVITSNTKLKLFESFLFVNSVRENERISNVIQLTFDIIFFKFI